jgi:hypothetical protein
MAKGELIKMSPSENEGAVQPRIVRGPVDSLSLYEITDYELDLLEQGSPNSIFLNFGVFFTSIAISFLVTLLTVKIESTKVFILFVVFAVVGFAGGGVLLVLWYRTRSRISGLMRKIRARVPTVPTMQKLCPQPALVGQTESSNGS